MINPISQNMNVFTDASVKKVSDDAEDRAKKDFAEKFEALVLNKLFDTVEKSMPDSGFDADPAGKQVKGLFWSFLSQGVAKQGGVGLADQIYHSLSKENPSNNNPKFDQKV